MKILGLIPARGDSKGIVDKNIVDLAGKPLIYYSIQQAKGVEDIDRVFVSTDSPRIQSICKSYGLDVPFLRPDYLARDNTRTIDVVIDLLECLKTEYNEEYDYVCLLQPTSPLRNSDDIRNCIDIIKEYNCDSVVSVSLVSEPHPYKMKVIRNGNLQPLIEGSDSSTPRQELPEIYQLNGAVFLTSVKVILDQKSHYGENCQPYIMPEERSVDVNTKLDLQFVELLMSKKK